MKQDGLADGTYYHANNSGYIQIGWFDKVIMALFVVKITDRLVGI